MQESAIRHFHIELFRQEVDIVCEPRAFNLDDNIICVFLMKGGGHSTKTSKKATMNSPPLSHRAVSARGGHRSCRPEAAPSQRGQRGRRKDILRLDVVDFQTFQALRDKESPPENVTREAKTRVKVKASPAKLDKDNTGPSPGKLSWSFERVCFLELAV